MTNKALAKIFKALGDETRLEIVRMLAGKEHCVYFVKLMSLLTREKDAGYFTGSIPKLLMPSPTSVKLTFLLPD